MLRHQLNVLYRPATSMPRLVPPVSVAEECHYDCPAGYRGALASVGLSALLAMEVAGQQPHPADECREPAAGCAAYSWRVAEARNRGRAVDGRQVPSVGLAGARHGQRSRNHGAGIDAMDFLVVPTIKFRLLSVLVILRHEWRRPMISLSVADHPTAEWIARQITEAFSWDEAPTHLIRDRDARYGHAVRRRLVAMGIRDHPTAPRSP